MTRIVRSWKRPGGLYTGRVYSERLQGLPGDCSAHHCAEAEASNGHMVCTVTGAWYVEFECPVHGIAPKWNSSYERLVAMVLADLTKQGVDITRVASGDYEV